MDMDILRPDFKVKVPKVRTFPDRQDSMKSDLYFGTMVEEVAMMNLKQCEDLGVQEELNWKRIPRL